MEPSVPVFPVAAPRIEGTLPAFAGLGRFMERRQAPPQRVDTGWKAETWGLGVYPYGPEFQKEMLRRIRSFYDEICTYTSNGDLPCEEDIAYIQDLSGRLLELENVLIVYKNFGYAHPYDTSIASRIALLETEWLALHATRLGFKIRGVQDAMRGLTEETADGDLITRWRRIEEEETRGTASIDRKTTLRRQDLFLILLSDTWAASGARSNGVTTERIPEGLRTALFEMADFLYRMDLLQEGLSAATAKAFVHEAFSFYATYLPGPSDACTKFLYPKMTRHLLLESRPTAEGLLKSVTSNLRAYRHLFPSVAGDLWSRRARYVQELTHIDGTSTGFFLSLERGIIECEFGLGLYIYEGDPAGQGPFYSAARLGLLVGEDDSIRIVNFQTAIPTLNPDVAALEAQRERMKGALGGLTALDALVAAAIHTASGMSLRRIEGIDDKAQQPLQDAIAEGGRQPLYGPTFARFGFEPPPEGSDAWSLDLETFAIFDPEVPSGPHDSLEYFWRVLSRRNAGNRIKYADWRKQKPKPDSPKLRAFLDVIAVALRQLDYQSMLPEERTMYSGLRGADPEIL